MNIEELKAALDALVASGVSPKTEVEVYTGGFAIYQIREVKTVWSSLESREALVIFLK